MPVTRATQSAAAALLALLLSTTAIAESYYEVTVTNLTPGMTFTPIMVATTRHGERFFEPGQAASDALEIMAETGELGPLQDSLDALDISNSAFLPFLAPGESVTQLVATDGRYRALSIAAMLVPSNDMFFAVNGIDGPRGRQTLRLAVPAWDAGTETNDELCASLPGPGCGPDPGPVSSLGEGFVHISRGVRGIADLDANLRDFRNPVAEITIRRIGKD